jgi:predicted nucleic acid-binding protein
VRIYLDSSALIKRVVREEFSADLIESVDRRYEGGALLVTSVLAWVEVSRALRSLSDTRLGVVATQLERTFYGVSDLPLSVSATSLARRVDPHRLRSLDALHLASALLIDADLVFTYDHRLADACHDNGLAVSAPGAR